MIVQDGLRRMFAEQEDVFYYITLMNENYSHPGAARRTGRDEVIEGIKRGMYLLRARPAIGDAAGAAVGQRHDPARGRGRRRAAGRATGVCPPTSGAARASPSWPATARTWSGGTCCTRPSRSASAGSTSGWPSARPVRWSPPRTTCALRRPDPRRTCPPTAATPCSARTASAAPTTAATCARTSRSTATTSLLAALSALAARAPSRRASVAEAITRYGIDPDKPDPVHA